MADQGSPDVMGRQASDRPPKGVMDRLKRLFEKNIKIYGNQGEWYYTVARNGSCHQSQEHPLVLDNQDD
jgi:hypothetical protein